MVSFVRHSDRSKFSERTTCLHIRGLSMSPLYSENRAITGCLKSAEKKFLFSIGSTATISGVVRLSTISRLVSY